MKHKKEFEVWAAAYGKAKIEPQFNCYPPWLAPILFDTWKACEAAIEVKARAILDILKGEAPSASRITAAIARLEEL